VAPGKGGPGELEKTLFLGLRDPLPWWNEMRRKRAPRGGSSMAAENSRERQLSRLRKAISMLRSYTKTNLLDNHDINALRIHR
jgi:hypothetical protein